MASRKYKCRNCKGRRRSSNKKTHRKRSHKWHQKGCQKGCQSGGGSMTGGWSWNPSDVHASAGGGATGGGADVPISLNGNHYALNTSGGMAPPQSSNHLVEKGMFGGRRQKSPRSRRSRRSRRGRKFIGEQHGGMAALMPEAINSALRGTAEIPSSIANTIQGASTPFRTSDPTQQPIGQAIQLQ